jgi:RNA recognition motif-containing protein
VGNISWSTSSEDLAEYMSSAGQIVSCVVQAHADTGRPKGWALVKYATPAQAQYAVNQFNQQDFHERQLSVRLDRAKLEDLDGTIVFVGNLSWSCTDAELAQVFRQYEPAEVRVKTTASGKSRGFALIRFEDEAKAALAISQMNHTLVGDREIEVREDRPIEERINNSTKVSRRKRGNNGGGNGGETNAGGSASVGNADKKSSSDGKKKSIVSQPCLTLYVNNLNWNSVDDDLFQHFCTAGVTPTSAKIQMSETNGRSRGWGLVTYATLEDAECALTQLNKTILDERKISVRYDAKSAE